MEKNGKDPSIDEEEEVENINENSESEKEEKKQKKEKKYLNKKREKEKVKEKKEENEDIIVGEKEVAFLLDQKRRVTVHKFKNQLKVDIREYYEDQGEMKPGKKGISLSIDNWNKLKNFIDNIDEAIEYIK